MKFIKHFILLILCISCNKHENEIEKNKYQILNLIYSDYSKKQMEFFTFPAKQPINLANKINFRKLNTGSVYKDSLHNKIYSKKISRKDSLLKIKKYVNNKENQQIFAFDIKMKRYHNLKNINLEENIIGFNKLYQNFISSKKIGFIKINQILPKNNDSLIVFNKSLLKNKIGIGFRKFDVHISFSDVVFSEDYSKAIIIGTRSFSGTDSHSLIYFLEKEKQKWKIINQQIPLRKNHP